MLVHDVSRWNAGASEARSASANIPAEEFERRLGMTPTELHALVSDLAPARAAIYWLDLLGTCAVAYGALWCSLTDSFGVGVCLWLSLSACAVYRATLFTHELAHLPRQGFSAFRVVWNLLCGIPLLVPSFLYEMHGAHHDCRTYASVDDGEYRAFAAAPRLEALASVLVAFLAVPALVLRFVVLAPIGWLIPRFRRWLLAKASALVIDFRASRPLPAAIPARWTAQEAGCFVWCCLLATLTASGTLPFELLLRGYAVLTGAVFVNALRVLCAHRYRSEGVPVSFEEQVLDSNNFPRGLAFLWAPLGLRYHAVHHLFPSLPYHALGEAYHRLMQSMPQRSAFRQTYRRSFWAGLDDVVGRRRPNGSRP